MTSSHTAQGLASLGRHGDTMLVHMSPHEVAGLNFLAKKQGTKLTVNPDTGLPEAFKLGNFFKSLLPAFAGAMTGGAGMPLWAGIAAGAATGAVTSKDPLMGALTGGLGGYGGYGLGQGLFAAGAPATIPGSAATPGIVGSTGEIGSSLLNASRGIAPGAASATANAAGNVYNLADTAVNTSGLTAGNVNPALTNLQNMANTSGFTASAGTGASGVDKSFLGGMDRLGPGARQMGTGIKNIATGEPSAWDAFKASFAEPGAKPISDLAAYGKIGMPIGGALLGGLEPSDIYGKPINMSAAKEKEKYDPYATLNLSNDTGLRLIAEGGYIDGYAIGGTISNPSVGGGLSDLYNRPEGQALENISQDGYGIGRLGALSNAESMNTAKTLGYAMGGPVSFADGGDTNFLTDEIQPIGQDMGLTSLMPPATMPAPSGQAMPTQQVQNIATGLSDTASSDSSIIAQVANSLRTDPNYQPKNPIEASIVKQLKGTDPMQQGQSSRQGLGSIAPSQPMAPSYTASQPIGPTYYAGMNAPRGFAEGGETSMNLDTLPSLNLMLAGKPSANASSRDTSMGFPSNNSIKNILSKSIEDILRDVGRPRNYDPAEYAAMSPVERMATIALGPITSPFDRMRLSSGAPPEPKSYALNLNSGKQQAQYAHGGYLDGQGDGMSDSIPATIEGKQPARLADGEFVIPADVVSHLGNGSSKAGSKRLYAMLDKVRHARTGNKKQGKQIKADKYLPA
jgi:hypothetical protein